MPALTSQGTRLWIAGTEIGQITGFSAVNLTSDVADVTTLASASSYEEARTTVLRSGEVVIAVAWDPDALGHPGVLTRYQNQQLSQVYIQFPNANQSTWVIWGRCTAIAITADTSDAVRAEFTFKTSGVGTFTN